MVDGSLVLLSVASASILAQSTPSLPATPSPTPSSAPIARLSGSSVPAVGKEIRALAFSPGGNSLAVVGAAGLELLAIEIGSGFDHLQMQLRRTAVVANSGMSCACAAFIWKRKLNA